CVWIRSKHVHVLRAAAERHLQLSPFAKVKLDARVENAAKLRSRRAANSGPQGFVRSKADALKVINPTEVDPGRGRRIKGEHAVLARVEKRRSFGRAVHRRKVSAHTLGHRNHSGANCKAAHDGLSVS